MRDGARVPSMLPRVVGAALAIVTVIAHPARGQEGGKPDVPSITVRGEATAQVVPDTVVVVFGVVTQRTAAADAVAANSKATADAIALIRAEGIKPEDIATINAGLTPEISPPEKGGKIVGYRAENQLQVRFQPADRAGAILGRLVDKGVNDVESVAAVVGDDVGLHDRLRAQAAREARRQAEIYAGALDLTLGPVTRIDPEAMAPMPRMMAARKFEAAPASVPVELGQQTVMETVRVTFTLQPR